MFLRLLKFSLLFRPIEIYTDGDIIFDPLNNIVSIFNILKTNIKRKNLPSTFLYEIHPQKATTGVKN